MVLILVLHDSYQHIASIQQDTVVGNRMFSYHIKIWLPRLGWPCWNFSVVCYSEHPQW